MDYKAMEDAAMTKLDEWLKALMNKHPKDDVAAKKEVANDMIDGLKDAFPQRVPHIKKVVKQRMDEAFGEEG